MQERWCKAEPEVVQRKCKGGEKEMQRRCKGGPKEVQRCSSVKQKAMPFYLEAFSESLFDLLVILHKFSMPGHTLGGARGSLLVVRVEK